MLRRRIFQLVLAALAVGLPLMACREPTQITLVITTDVPCATVTAKGVDVRVGAPLTVDDQPTTDVSTSHCTDTTVGSIVVVPSGEDDAHVGIEVTLGTGAISSAACRLSSSSGCIIARRSLGYVPHTSLVLPIKLGAKCIDVACGPGQTCDEGVCKGDEVNTSQCPGGVCGPETLPPVDAGLVDAAPDAANDAAVDAGADAAPDGGRPTCAQICTGGICVGDVCQLAPAIMADPNDTAGCIAADATGKRVWWTSNRGTLSMLERVPRIGGVAAPVATAIPSGNAAGVAALGGIVNAAINDTTPAKQNIYEVGASLNLTSRSAVTGTEKLGLVARATNGDVCWTLGVGLMCTGWSQAQTISGGGTAVAGSTNYVGVAATTGAFVLIYKRINPAAGSVSPPIQGVSGLAANPASDAFFTFGGPGTPEIVQFVVNPAALTTLIKRPTSKVVGSVMAYDATSDSLFWTEQEPNSNTAYDIFSAKAAPAATPHLVATSIPHQNCIAVDDESVYWLNGGAPYKTAK